MFSQQARLIVDDGSNGYSTRLHFFFELIATTAFAS